MFLLLASVLVPAVLFAAYAAQSRALMTAEAESMLKRRVAMLAEHVARVLDSHATMIALIEAKLEGRSFAEIALDPTISSMLIAQGENSMAGPGVLVVDDTGTVVAGSLEGVNGLDASARDYFLGAQGGDGMHLGEQIVSRVTDRPIFTLSRRRADGGVIVTMLSVEYFADVFATLMGERPTGEMVTLYRADGQQLVRQPALPQPAHLPPGSRGLMEHMPHEDEGIYRAAPRSGGGERLYGFRKVPGYPAWVTHGRDVALLTAQWVRALVPQALLTIAAITLLAAGSLWVVRVDRQSEENEQKLEQAVAERTALAEQRAAEAETAAQARQSALRAAQRADEAKTHFLASASHDLRQPIQGVRLFLDVLEVRLREPEDRRVLGLATKALEGAESLLSTLLDVSALEAGMVSANPRTIPLGPLLGNLAEEFAPQARARGVRLRQVPTGVWAHTDPVLLARVLRNLLANAVRYTGSGGILLGCRRLGDSIRIEVRDTGPGIPADKHEAVFDDFVQLGNPERDRNKGLGLGLAVARRMAGLMGHPMGVVSHVGRGTAFWITLPIAATPASTTEERLPIAV